jgi:hypothetical protein
VNLRALPIGFVLVGAALVALLVALAPRASIDLQRSGGAELAARAAQLVEQLPDDVRITHYVSDRASLPGSYDGLATSAREALQALFADAPGVTLASADPDAHPEWVSFLNAAGVREWRARTIERDGWTERQLWSSLRIECGPAPAAVWNGVGPDDLPLFAPWVLGRLEQLAQPRRARIGVDAPAQYGVLRARLAALGELVEVDLGDARVTAEELDWIVWIDPRAIDGERLARLDDLLDAGCSALVAGSAWTATDGVADGAATLAVERSGFAAETFFAHYGLVAEPLPVFDTRCESTPGPDGAPLPRPHQLRCIAPNQDFRELVGQPNGNLPFTAPTSFRLDQDALESRGWKATTIATADDTAYHPPLDVADLPLADWNALPARQNARAPLAAYLRDADAWSGELLVFGASTPFTDDALQAAGGAPTALLRVVSDTLGSDERLVRRDLAGRRPAPLPELAPDRRIAWRVFVVAAIPLALALATWFLRRGRNRGTRTLRPLVPIAAGVLGAALLVPLLRARGLSLSAGSTTQAEVIATLERLAPSVEMPARIYTIFSFPGDLPAELRGPARDAVERCRSYAAALPGLHHESLVVAQGAELPESLRVEPLALRSALDERTTLRRVYSHVVLEHGTHSLSFTLESPEAFDELPFRLALLLERAQRGTPRKLAVVANPPRLSPAEVELEYNRRGLHAPRGGQSYSTSLDALRNAGFEVQLLDRTAPELADDTDALLWLQPRRDTLPVTAALAEHLAGGGNALVAGQHYRVIARQRDDSLGELRFWPQPQFCDLDAGYLPELGVRLEPEVLCDPLSAVVEVRAQVTVADVTDLRPLSSRQAFYLRVPSANRAEDFGGAADWVLPHANRWAFDPERLGQRKFALQVLAQTSAEPWTYAWTGGDLPAEVLAGQPTNDGALRRYQERLPLAIELHGSFPAARVALERTPDGRERARLDVAPTADGPPGRLMLIGASACFTDDHVRAGGSRMDQALLAATAELCLPADFVRLLPRESSATGFDYVQPTDRLLWRGVVVGLVPVLLLILALAARWRS